PEWSRVVTIVKQQHKLDEVSYHKLFDILKQYQNEVNELRAEKQARNANPLALVATAQADRVPYYQSSRSHKSQAPSSKPSIPTRSHTSTKHKGKEIAKPITPPSESASEEDSDPKQAQRDKDMQKNLALIAKYFKKLYKPTNNNLKLQEQESHYSYMAKIQEVPNADSGTDSEPVKQVQNNAEYNVFANVLQHSEQSESNDQNDVESNDERVMLANLIANLKLDVDENKKIQKQLKKANTSLAQELKECKAILAKTSQSLGSLLVFEIVALLIPDGEETLALERESRSKLNKDSEIDELESKKAEFSDMYDVILHDCVSKDVMCSYLQSLSDLDALAELQSWNEKASNVFRKEREQYIEIQDLKAKLQDKNIAISELKKLIEKGKGKSVDTKFDRPSIIRQPNAQWILKPSVLGKPTPFSDSLERRYFPKTRSLPKTNVSEGLSKPVTAQTLSQTAKKAVSNTNVFKPGMYRIDNRIAHTRAPQLPQTVRNTN
nr:hypothetical protein [Tanacetum cinerariifolium]